MLITCQNTCGRSFKCLQAERCARFRNKMEDDAMHFFVGNIPHSFRSADLRCHFSSYVEGKYFKCFHYRHRPEEYNSSQEEHPSLLFQEPPSAGSLTAEAKRTRKLTYCCVVAVKSHIGRTFMEKFSGNNWSRSDGGLLPGKVRISKLNIASEGKFTF